MQEDRAQTAISVPYLYPGADRYNSREHTAICGVGEALAWRHALEMSDDPLYLRPGQRIIAYPAILDKLSTVLQTGNVGLDPVCSRWHTYERILSQIQTWPQESRPIIVCEDDPEIGSIPDLAAKVPMWKEDAKRTAVGHFRKVLEDGPEFCSPESNNSINNNNTFTWSGPSGVLGCTGQRRVAPAAGLC
jgi:hypothetical protein